jgi:hypothetical protein
VSAGNSEAWWRFNSEAWWRFLASWGWISANGVGDLDLVRMNILLNAEKYRQILIHHAIPSGRQHSAA